MEEQENPVNGAHNTDFVIKSTNSLKISSNINSEDIDDKTKNVLRGDLIGDTMYSESFIIKTLLRFNNFKWDEEFESDLCFLWDMTVETDVCDYLFSHSFPSLVCDVLLNESENRLTEILIGILSNICIPEQSPPLKIKEIEIILNFLNTDDHLILIQVMRFIKIICYKTKEKLEFIDNTAMDKITFILSNSANLQLLGNTLDALVKITNDKKLHVNVLKGDIIGACIDAVETIREDEKHLEYNLYKTATTHWVQILVNISVYINDDTSNLRIFKEIKEHETGILEQFYNMLSPYQEEDEEIDLCSNDFTFLIDFLAFICPVLNLISDKMFYLLLNIFAQINDRQDVNSDIYNSLVEVICYFISVSHVESFLSNCDNKKYSRILNVIKDYNLKSDYDYKDALSAMINFSSHSS